jgi:hypothetical protein
LAGREIVRAELCGGPPAEVARTLASLAQTLKILTVLPKPPPEEEDTTDVDEMRRDIARCLGLLEEEKPELVQGEGI